MQVKVAVAGPGPISRKPVLAAAEPCDCPTCGRCSSTIKVFTRASWTRTCQHRSWHESGLAHCVRGHVPGPHLQNAVQEAVGGRRDSKNHLPNRRATPGTSGDRSQQLRRSWLIHRQRANKSRRGGGKKKKQTKPPPDDVHQPLGGNKRGPDPGPPGPEGGSGAGPPGLGALGGGDSVSSLLILIGQSLQREREGRNKV